jgi:hypothetical protein
MGHTAWVMRVAHRADEVDDIHVEFERRRSHDLDIRTPPVGIGSVPEGAEIVNETQKRMMRFRVLQLIR